MNNLLILEECFKEGMINKDFESFKRNYPTLLKVILRAMQRATETNTVLCKPEGSDGSEGASVGNGADGQSGSAVKVKTGTIVFCEGEQFVFGINRKTGKIECFNLYGMSGISDEAALPR